MLVTNLAILVLAGFVGYTVISKVPNTLHTPLMSGTNAIHGIVVLAGLLVIGLSANDTFNKVILVIAIAFGTINVVGGFLVTDRMLGMFKRRPEPVKELDEKPEPKPPGEVVKVPEPDSDSSGLDSAAAATAPESAPAETPDVPDPAEDGAPGEPAPKHPPKRRSDA